MAGKVIDFLQLGADHGPVEVLEKSVAVGFLPSLALAATQVPPLTAPLLSSLVSHPQTPRALLYASLDYGEIALAVEQAEGAGDFCLRKEESSYHALAGETSEKRWEWTEDEDDEDDEIAGMDECDAFQQGDEIERAKLALISLRKRAASFSIRRSLSNNNLQEDSIEQQGDDDEGSSIWSNEACLPELLCLLPVVVSCCPSLCLPEQLVKGLLTARYSCLLLATTLANNPSLVDQAALFLAQFLKVEADFSDAGPNSSLLQESTLTPTTAAAKTSSGVIHQHGGFVPSQTCLSTAPTDCAHAALQTLISLCQLAPSFASTCRDALVYTGTLLEMVLHITEEVLHDELEFLSRLIFSKEATSQWILSHLGARQRARDSLVLPPLGKKKVTSGIETDSVSEKEGSVARIRAALLADARSTCQKMGWGGRLHAHVRLYCVLVRAGDLSPTHEEVEFWLKALATSLGQPEFVSERTLQLGIAFVCLVPGLSGPSTRNMFHAAMGRLLRAAIMPGPLLYTPLNIILAVWVAVQLLLRKFADIAVLVREAVGMHVTVPNALMRDVAEAASGAGVIADPSLVTNAVAVLRPHLTVGGNKKQQDLALKCMEQLIHANTFNFSRYSVDISNALMHILSFAQEPIHPLLPQLVHSYAEMSTTVPRGRGPPPPFRMRPFSHEWLRTATAPACQMLSHKSSSCSIWHKVQAENVASWAASQKRGLLEQCSFKHMDLRASGDPVATASLAVYYMLCREQISRNIGVDAGSNSWESSQSEPGEEGNWAELCACLPLRPLLLYMEEHWIAYEHLLPQWLAVASIVFPERFLVPALIQDSSNSINSSIQIVHGVPTTADLGWVGPTLIPRVENLAEDLGVDPLYVVLKNSDLDIDSWHDGDKHDVKYVEILLASLKNALKEPLPTLKILQVMGRDSSKQTAINAKFNKNMCSGHWAKACGAEAAVVKELVPLLLDPACPRILQDSFCSWWQSLPSSTTEYLVPLFVKSLQDPTDSLSNAGGHSSKTMGLTSQRNKGSQLEALSSSCLPTEPLGLLACSAAVFRTPLLGIMLDLMVELLAASRRICQAVATEGGRDGGIKREEVAAALVAQDSAVCQILLEGCLPVAAMGDDEETGPLLEARSLVCATISSLLHTSPLLLKLLHFQGYDPILVPMMVKGVPTVVQCLDFIGELLQLPSQQCQVFGVVLTVHIACSHASLPQSIAAAHQAVAHVSQLLKKVVGSAGFLQEVLSPLAQCAAAFPVLAPHVVAIIQSCAQTGGPLARSGPTRDPSLLAASIMAFRQLIDRKLLPGRAPMSMARD